MCIENSVLEGGATLGVGLCDRPVIELKGLR